MADEFKYKEIPTGLPAETALEVASALSNVVPWIGGPIANVLSGLSVGRKIDRVKEVLEGLGSDLRDFRSEASEAYVKTDEFEDLLERTLRQAAETRSQEKRQVLRSFLVGAVKKPGESYDEQKHLLRLIEDLEPDHMRILRALGQEPEEDLGDISSHGDTLRKRLPDMTIQRIQDLTARLNDLRITNLTSLNTMMTARGAADLRHAITPLGQILVRFI